MPVYTRSSPHYRDSNLLAYWYDHTTSEKTLSHLLDTKVQDFGKLLSGQFKNFIYNQNKLKATMISIAGEQNRNAILRLFEVTQYDHAKLKAVMEPGSDGSINFIDLGTAEGDSVSLDSIQNGAERLKRVYKNCRKFNTKVKTFKKAVKEIIDGLSPQGKYKDVLNDAIKDLWNGYLTKAEFGPVELDKATAEQKTQIAKQVLIDIISRNNHKIFQKAGDRNVGLVEGNAGLGKIIAAIWALDNFSEFAEYVPEGKGIAVKHGNNPNPSGYATSAEEMVEELARKIRGCAIVMSGLAGELVAAYAFLNKTALQRLKKELKGNITASAETMGGQSLTIQKTARVRGRDLIREIEEAERLVSEVETQTSKGDVGITISNGNISATLPFSVKVSKGKINTPDAKGATSITLQSGTSLLQLLEREAHMNEAEQKAVMELLATHGNDGSNNAPTPESTLDRRWEKMKKILAYLSFIDMLTGSTAVGKAYFMIAGTRLVSMEYIIRQVMEGGNLSTSLQKSNTGAYSLQRSSFLDANKWQGDEDTPDATLGYERAAEVYQEVKSRLSSTIIRSKLNIKQIENFAMV